MNLPLEGRSSLFRIGEFSEMAGVSARVLRNYDEAGLFRPAWIDPNTGYRWYSPAQLPELRRIVALKDLGIPLAEVADLVTGGDLRAALEHRKEQVRLDRARAERLLAELRIRVEMDEVGPDVVVRRLAAERIASIRTRTGPGSDLGQLFYELEEVVRDAGARASRPPGTIVHRVHRDASRDLEVYVPVTATVAEGRIATRTMSAVDVASLIHRGGYDSVPTTLSDLRAWVDGAGLEAAGPARIVYLRFGAEPELAVPDAFLATASSEFVTELQVELA